MTETTYALDDSRPEDRLLILMRHAKSDWGDESLSDHDRQLNRRGRRDAPRMARWLAEADIVPDVILSSSSVRTQETAELMTSEWSVEPTVLFSESLYLATPEAILGTVRSDAGDARRLMVLAHNPGMAHLVSHLSDQIADMPTAAIAVFRLSCKDWSEIQPSTPMSLVELMKPKAL
jgi:phosphohistidine phosphatase